MQAGKSSRLVSVIVVIASAGLLAGCGSTTGNRVGGGMAGGAATGAAFGLIGGPIGVLIGGAVGGGIGALTANNTTPKQIDLGNPPWAGGPGSREGGAAPSRSQVSGQSDLRGQVQQYRSNSGYEPAQANQNEQRYGQPQQLNAPSNGQNGYGQSGYGQSGYGSTGVQAQPLAPPSRTQ